MSLSALIRQARKAMPQNMHFRSDGDVVIDQRRSPLAAVRGRVNLFGEDVVQLKENLHTNYHFPQTNVAAGRREKLPAIMTRGSRVLSSGAKLIALPEVEPAIGNSKVPVFKSIPCGYVLIDPAHFSVVNHEGDEDGEVSVSNLPIHEAFIERDSFTQRAVRFEISRKTQKTKRDDELNAEVITSLSLGIGRAIDNEVTSTVLATNPSDFSLSAAANSGLKFGELQALIGTLGKGAELSSDSKLTAMGVPAELTADTSATIIGAFDRCAVVINGEIDLLIERRKLNGALAVTAWVDIQALLPDTSKFWVVANNA